MLRAWILWAVVVCVLAGCATPYRPPSEPAPPSWTGEAGVRVTGPVTFNSGTFEEGAVIGEYPIEFVRTGVIRETVQTKTAFGADFILPAGLPVYAMDFELYSSRAGYVQRDGKENPIEWCGVLPNGTDGQGEQPVGFCLFWETSERARYMQIYRSFPYLPTGMDSSGMPGPMPIIDEQPVDFGVVLTNKVVISKLTKKWCTITTYVTDGEGRGWQGRRRERFDPYGRANAWLMDRGLVLEREIDADDTIRVKVRGMGLS